MNEGLAILGGHELYADAMRAALERMNLPVVLSAGLVGVCEDDLRTILIRPDDAGPLLVALTGSF